MADIKQTVLAVGNQLGLRTRLDSSIVFGDLHGYLVQMTPVKDQHGRESILTIIRHGMAKASAPTSAVIEGVDLDTAGIKPKDVSHGDDFVTYSLHRGSFRGFNAESAKRTFEVVFDRVRASREPVGATCGECGEPHSGDPLLINGMVGRLCPACVDELHRAAAEVQAAYDALPVNLPRAVAAAAVVAVLGALVWAGIAIAANAMFWMLAIGIGAAIGVVTTKAAGKRDVIVQVIGGTATVVSVLLGQLLFTAYLVQKIADQEQSQVDWMAFVASSPQILIDSGGDTLFALGGGLIGAVYAARRAAKPKIEVTIEN